MRAVARLVFVLHVTQAQLGVYPPGSVTPRLPDFIVFNTNSDEATCLPTTLRLPRD